MCQSLGLRNPDAKTKRLAVVVVHLASKDDPTPQVAYDDVHVFSDLVDDKRSSVCSKQSMAVFPEDPSVFMTAYPDAFGPDDPPVECRISLSAIVERCRKGVTPCRSTNQQLRGRKTPHCAIAAPAPSDSVNGALLSILEKFMFQKGRAPLASEMASHRAPLGEMPPVGDTRTSSSYGASPAEMFSGGGATPGCLDPCHDKLARLTAKLGCATSGEEPTHLDDGERGAGEWDAGSPLPRISKKRPLAAATAEDGEGSELEEVDDAMPIVKKRPAAAPKIAPKGASAPVAPKAVRKSAATSKSSGGVSKSIHEALLKKPAKVARPAQSTSPTSHAGGKIYFSKPKNAYRVYLRAGDRIEKVVSANAANKEDMGHKFKICCALIENDKRPR